MNNSYSGTDSVETRKDGAEEEEEGMVLSGLGLTSIVLCVWVLVVSLSSGSFYLQGNDV